MPHVTHTITGDTRPLDVDALVAARAGAVRARGHDDAARARCSRPSSARGSSS